MFTLDFGWKSFRTSTYHIHCCPPFYLNKQNAKSATIMTLSRELYQFLRMFRCWSETDFAAYANRRSHSNSNFLGRQNQRVCMHVPSLLDPFAIRPLVLQHTLPVILEKECRKLELNLLLLNFQQHVHCACTKSLSICLYFRCKEIDSQ